MFYIKAITKLKFLIIVLSLEGIKCSIDGTISIRRGNETKTGEDPCNPLYWYPKAIPEYCNYRTMPTPPPDNGPGQPIPVPIPVPLPPHVPIPVPVLPPPVMPPMMPPMMSPMMPPMMPPGPPPPIAIPHPIMPLPMPLPFGIPLAPTNPMVPVAGIPLPPPLPVPLPMPYPPPVPYPPPFGSPYVPPFPPAFPPAPLPPPMSPYPPPYPSAYPSPYPPFYPGPYPMPPRRGIGMIPGIPGIVSSDGGVNIMPFSDAYADMLERHKQKMIRRRMQKMLDNYERPPWKSRRKTRRHNCNKASHEDKHSDNDLE